MSEEKEFKPGDLVQLRSGGPVMTVEGTSSTWGGLICSWFDGKTRKQDTFNPAALAPYVARKSERRTVSEGFRVSRS